MTQLAGLWGVGGAGQLLYSFKVYSVFVFLFFKSGSLFDDDGCLFI